MVSIPRPSIAQAASAPATGFSEGAIAPAACPATQPTPPAARKPRSKPQLTTCRLRAGAALAAFAAAGIELSVGAVLPALTEAKASSPLASGSIQRPPRCPERRQERRAWRDSEEPLAALHAGTKEIGLLVDYVFKKQVSFAFVFCGCKGGDSPHVPRLHR